MDEFSIELEYMFDIINLNKSKLDMPNDVNTHYIKKRYRNNFTKYWRK
jgi:hypothetical protein